MISSKEFVTFSPSVPNKEKWYGVNLNQQTILLLKAKGPDYELHFGSTIMLDCIPTTLYAYVRKLLSRPFETDGRSSIGTLKGESA